MKHPLILFDGVCNFCNRTVIFIIRQDKKGIFRFAPLQSKTGQDIITQAGLPQNDPESVIYYENGKVFRYSTAALRICRRLPWYWQWTQLFWIVPKFIRDALYRLFAKNRYRLFGKKDTCMIPSPAVRSRFLND